MPWHNINLHDKVYMGLYGGCLYGARNDREAKEVP
jgi:hypothetical protein